MSDKSNNNGNNKSTQRRGLTGWSIEMYGRERGIRIQRGACGSGLEMELIIDPTSIHELPDEITKQFSEQEGWDEEQVARFWWCLPEEDDVKAFCKRVLAMIELDEAEGDVFRG